MEGQRNIMTKMLTMTIMDMDDMMLMDIIIKSKFTTGDGP